MGLSATYKTDFIFKKIKGRRFTTGTKQWYEEFPGYLVFPHAQDIWADPIPTPAPSQSTTTVAVYDDLVLTEDNTTNDHKAWLACSVQGDFSTLLTRWIPPRYHQSYTVRIFDDNNNEIFTTHPSNWLFDYENGILIFENDPTTYGITLPIHLKGYRYVGNVGTGSGTSTNITLVHDVFTVDSQIANDHVIILSETPLVDYPINISCNGLNLFNIIDYTIDNHTVTFTTTVWRLTIGDRIDAQYHSIA